MSLFADSLESDLNPALLEEFGEPITYRKLANPDVACSAVWTDEIPEASQPGIIGRADISDTELTLTPSAGDLIIRNSVTFRVVEPVIKDGGMWKLQLRK